jgi:hypothetical protein
MTSPTPPTVAVSPATIPVSSPDQYLPQDLTVTIHNPNAASYDLSGGLTISLPVDPGGGGTASQDALVLTSASLDPNGAATPVVAITGTSLTPGSWSIQPDTASGPCVFLVQPVGDGTIDAGGNIGFTFSQVVADLVTGTPNITVTILPAVPGQPSLVLYVSVSKVATALNATIKVLGTSGLNPPDNTVQLIWQTTAADSCRLDWAPGAAMVAYDNQEYTDSWTTNVPTQFPQDGPFPVATIYQQNAASFKLTAFGQGTSYSTSTPTIGLATPRLNALTIPPLVTGVAPLSGDPRGGQQVTITGTGLYGTNATVAVLFGTVSATNVVVSSDGGVVNATAPPGTGTVLVTVVTPAGSSPATPAASYTYTAANMPAVTGIDPPGGEAGGQQVTITGPGLAGATAVSFGGVNAGPPAVNPDGSITVTAPPCTLGAGAGTSTVPVTVTTPAGTSPPSPAAQYTYAAAGVPVVFGVGQDGAGDPYGGQSPVTITGINFGAVTSLSFGHAQTSANFTVDSTGTTIVATAPPVSAADDTGSTYRTTVDVTVTVPGGTTGPVVSAVTPAGHYTYATTSTNVTTSTNFTVAPNQPFQLIWSCYTGTGPTLQWSETENYPPVADTVKVTVGGQTFSTGQTIPITGSALVRSNAPVTFQLQVGTPGGPVPDPVTVGMEPFAFTQFTYALVAVPGNGTQSVVLMWTAQNATGFVLSGGGIAYLQLPFDQRSYPVPNLPVGSPTLFELGAYGFGQQSSGNAEGPVSKYLPLTVTPVPVEITGFSIRAQGIPPSSTSITVRPYQAVTLNWSAYAATGYTLAALGPPQSLGLGITSETDVPSQSTIYLLTALGYAPSGQPPTARVEAVVYRKPKEQVAAGEKLPNGREKEPPDYPKVVLAHGTVPGPGDLAEPEPEPAGGSLEAFVTPSERSDAVPPAEAGTEPPAAGPA